MRRIFTWVQKANSISCLFSFALVKGIESPQELAKNVRRKLDCNGSWLEGYIPDWLRTTKLNRTRDLVFKVAHRIYIHRLKVRLSLPLYESVPLRTSSSRELRPIYFSTSSLPYTQSGYSIRTNEILRIYQRLNIEPIQITRLGYPAVIGDLRRFPSQNGFASRFLIPWVMPYSEAARINLAAKMLAKQARSLGANLIHTTTSYENALVASKAARIAGIPWIYEVRGLQHLTAQTKENSPQERRCKGIPYRKWWDREVEAASFAAKTIFISDTIRREYFNSGVNQVDTLILPNCTDKSTLKLQPDRNNLKKQLALQEKKIVGVISSIVSYEGIEYAIRAMKWVDGNAILLVVGTGEDLVRLRKLADDLEVSSRIRFEGRVPFSSVWKFYGVLDVFVVPRTDERVCELVPPIKPLTALAFGVPIVASDLPALREVTENKATFVEPRNPLEIAKAINDILRRSNENAPMVTSSIRTWANYDSIFAEFLGIAD